MSGRLAPTDSDEHGIAAERRARHLTRWSAFHLLARGIVAATIGVVVVLWPQPSARVAARLIGGLLVVFSLLLVADAARRDRPRAESWGYALRAGLTGSAGLVAILWPGITVTVLAVLLGLHLLVMGGVALVYGWLFRSSDPEWVSVTTRGAIGLAAGLITLFWPNITVAVLVIIQGVNWLLGGLVSMAVGLRLNALVRRLRRAA